MNKSLPPVEVFVRDEYLFKKSTKGMTRGFLMSVRSLKNQALQFSVLLENGALFTGLPVWALAHKQCLPLPGRISQMWDNISNEIDVFTIEQLKYVKCSVKLTNDNIVTGFYLFTIDYVGYTDLSSHPEHWKQLHVIFLDNGQIVCYPQYRIQFKDLALCPESDKSLPRYSANKTTWVVE